MQIARLRLENEDPDSAVNRAYYAMFNISRAAVLKAGVADDSKSGRSKTVKRDIRRRISNEASELTTLQRGAKTTLTRRTAGKAIGSLS